MENKRKVGRPKKTQMTDKTQSYSVSLTPIERDTIVRNYGSLTNALRRLCIELKERNR